MLLTYAKALGFCHRICYSLATQLIEFKCQHLSTGSLYGVKSNGVMLPPSGIFVHTQEPRGLLSATSYGCLISQCRGESIVPHWAKHLSMSNNATLTYTGISDIHLNRSVYSTPLVLLLHLFLDFFYIMVIWSISHLHYSNGLEKNRKIKKC